MPKRKTVIQNHHIRYKNVPRFAGDGTEEWKVPIFKGEHELLWKLHRRRRISEGYLIALEEELALFRRGVEGRVVVHLESKAEELK